MEIINGHTNTQITYITINLTKQHLIVIALRETVQLVCEMILKVNTQKIYTVKKKHLTFTRFSVTLLIALKTANFAEL